MDEKVLFLNIFFVQTCKIARTRNSSAIEIFYRIEVRCYDKIIIKNIRMATQRRKKKKIGLHSKWFKVYTFSQTIVFGVLSLCG